MRYRTHFVGVVAALAVLSLAASCGTRAISPPEQEMPEPALSDPVDAGTMQLTPEPTREVQTVPSFVSSVIPNPVSGGISGPWSSVVLHNGKPYVAYAATSSIVSGIEKSGLFIAYASSTTPSATGDWTAVLVDASTSQVNSSIYTHTGAWIDMVEHQVSGSNRLAIAYYDVVGGDLKLAISTQTGPTATGHFTVTTTDYERDAGTSASLISVPNTYVAVASYSAYRRSIRFVRSKDQFPTQDAFAADGYYFYSIDGDYDIGSYCGLNLFGTSSIPAIAYYDESRADLRYVKANNNVVDDATDWGTPYAIAATGNVGQFCNLAKVDSKPVIVFQEVTGDTTADVRIATSSVAEPTSVGSWTVGTIDTGGSYGWMNTCVINNVLFVAWANRTSSTDFDVWAARPTVSTNPPPTSESSWESSVVQSVNAVGLDVALCAGASNNLWMSYSDGTQGTPPGRIRFTRATSSWVP